MGGDGDKRKEGGKRKPQRRCKLTVPSPFKKTSSTSSNGILNSSPAYASSSTTPSTPDLSEPSQPLLTSNCRARSRARLPLNRHGRGTQEPPRLQARTPPSSSSPPTSVDSSPPPSTLLPSCTDSSATTGPRASVPFTTRSAKTTSSQPSPTHGSRSSNTTTWMTARPYPSSDPFRTSH